MTRRFSLCAAAALVAVLSPALGTAATAAPTQTAVLDCGANAYTVDGFGRGQVLHVTGSNRNFVVTRAVLADGTVVFDSPAKADRQVATCTTTSPSGADFTFTGFFTPAR